MKFGNPGPGLGQAQKCGEVKPVNLLTHASNNVIKHFHQFALQWEISHLQIILALINANDFFDFFHNREDARTQLL